jgi:membrane protein YqaA with SNARE-associated domain
MDEPPASTPMPSTTDDLEAYIRRNVLVGLVVVGLLVAIVGAASVFYEEALFAFTQAIYHRIGLAGLMTILFVTDSVITPIPPDFILIVIAKSELSAHWLGILLMMGALSSVAGNVAWYLGRRLGGSGVLGRVFGRLRDRHARLVCRYGWIAVALGAMTPIPFSVTCWTAGLLRLRFRSVAWPTLLRFPRFFLYYAFFAYSDVIVRWLV